MKVLYERYFPNELICHSSITGSLDMYILKFEKGHDFARSIFSFKKFQEVLTKSLFLSFQNSFPASYFLISQEPRDQNSSLTLLWNNN